MAKHNHAKHNQGFTIVELLIVIVVIAILAAITVIAFTGMQTRAEEAKLQADLQGAVKLVQAEKALTGNLPVSLSAVDENKGVKPSEGTNLEYSIDGSHFYLTAISTARQAKAFCFSSQTNSITEGEVCPGHQEPAFGPVNDPVVYTQVGSFSGRGVEPNPYISSIPIGYDLRPSDYVFVLFSADFRTVLTLEDPSGQPISSIYAKSMGASGYLRHYAYGISGLSGRPTLTTKSCWNYADCREDAIATKASYIVYVIRGLGSNPTFNATSTSYGSQPRGTTVTPAAQSLGRGKLAIFSSLSLANYNPTYVDASSPRLTWTIDSNISGHILSTGIRARHAYAESAGTVEFQMHTNPTTGGGNYHGMVLFTFN